MSLAIPDFTPFHCHLTREDARDRYFIIPGCPSRAKMISETYLSDVTVRPSKRGHTVYLGCIRDTKVPVGVVATGMGCPSVDIIVTELIQMGAKYFIRVGTAGSFNLDKYPIHSMVVASGAVRDESTSCNYAPKEFPAISSPEITQALITAGENLVDIPPVKTGIMHTKDSLYAREFLLGTDYKAQEHQQYMRSLEQLGVAASEMEAAHLFVLGSVYGVHTGCICTMIGGTDPTVGSFSQPSPKGGSVNPSITVALEAIKILFRRKNNI